MINIDKAYQKIDSIGKFFRTSLENNLNPFVGYFVGSNLTPNLVSRVGHIRVFAAFASTASLSILIIATYVNPVVWTLGRFLTGISLVSCFVVSESWLND